MMKRYMTVTSILIALGSTSDAAASTADTVRLEMRDGRPVVEGVYVNGQGPYRFLLDTGSTLSHLDPHIAQLIGVRRTMQTMLRSSSGSMSVDLSEGNEILVAGVAADQQALVLGGTEGLRELGRDLQGILGQEFLSRFDYRLDLKAKRLEFAAPPSLAAATRVACRRLGGRPVLATNVGALVLDSGAHYAVRFGVHAPQQTHEMVMSTGIVHVGTVFTKVTVDGRTVWQGDAVAIPQAGEPGIDGLLPISGFGAVYVSNSESFVVFE
jgi:hypothetical protein